MSDILRAQVRAFLSVCACVYVIACFYIYIYICISICVRVYEHLRPFRLTRSVLVGVFFQSCAVVPCEIGRAHV